MKTILSKSADVMNEIRTAILQYIDTTAV